MTRFAMVAGALVLFAATTTVAQQGTFRATVESVRIDALVTENNLPLTGLTAADFEVFDDGARQAIDYVSVDTLPINLVLSLDLSDSVVGASLDRLRAAAAGALSGLRRGDQAALLTFGDSLRLRSPLTADLAQVERALTDGVGAGATPLIDAAYATMWIGHDDPGRAVAIVFSDGMDTGSWLRAERVLDAARRSSLVVYGVTLDRGSDERFLSDLSETSGGRVFRIDSTRRLPDTFNAILDEFRRRYVISYTLKGTPRTGWHEVDVRVKGHRAKITARRGYLAGPR